MSLQIEIAISVPQETARVAHAAFPKGNVYMTMRDQLGTLFEDQQFADLFPPQGQPAQAPWRLSLVTVMQFAENLPDRQAADAVRSRIDWKYAMGLELTDPGFDFSVLSEFRGRLLQHGAEQRLFETLLALCRERGWLKARGKQRTDSTHVLSAIHALNRLENTGETLRHALNVLAQEAPDWLRTRMLPEWADRYGKRFENYRLPRDEAERKALAVTVFARAIAFGLAGIYGTAIIGSTISGGGGAVDEDAVNDVEHRFIYRRGPPTGNNLTPNQKDLNSPKDLKGYSTSTSNSYASFVAQPKEPGVYIVSTKTGGNDAFDTSAQVTLTPPVAKPAAVSHIQVGYIQKGDIAGSADYTLTNVNRVLSVPANGTLDWYNQGSTDKFPWYDSGSIWSPSGSGLQSKSIALGDSPTQDLPSEWRSFTPQGQPNTTNPNYGQKLSSSSVALNFQIFIAAQTLDTDNGASNNYFDESDGYWGVDFDWPVDPRYSIVRAGNPISPPTVVTPISVNIVPLFIDRQELWGTWVPYY